MSEGDMNNHNLAIEANENDDFDFEGILDDEIIEYKTMDEVLKYANETTFEDIDLDDYEIVDGKLLDYYGYKEKICIPSSVRQIGHRAFARNTNLKAILLRDHVNVIESDAFSECINLEIVAMSDKVNYIGDSAFANCASLRLINLSNDLDIIKESCFEGCTALKSIELPKHLTIIENAAFAYSGLLNVRIPATVRYIGMFAFEHCDDLMKVILPEGLKIIDEQSFSACHNLVSITIPNSVTKIKEYAFESSGITEIVLPENLISIRPTAFKNCTDLTRVRSFRDYIFFKKQNSRIFQNCFSLKDDEEAQNIMYEAYKNLDLAKAALYENDYQEARRLFKLSADAGYGPAYAGLAYLEFLNNQGSLAKSKGVEYLKLGAAINNPACIYNLACCYLNGEGGLDVDLNEALRLSLKATEYGFNGAEELSDSIKYAIRHDK